MAKLNWTFFFLFFHLPMMSSYVLFVRFSVKKFCTCNIIRKIIGGLFVCLTKYVTVNIINFFYFLFNTKFTIGEDSDIFIFLFEKNNRFNENKIIYILLKFVMIFIAENHLCPML